MIARRFYLKAMVWGEFEESVRTVCIDRGHNIGKTVKVMHESAE